MPSFRSVAKLWSRFSVPMSGFVCLFIWACFVNKQTPPPYFQLPSISTEDSSLFLYKETSLPVRFTDKTNDSFWRGDALAVLLGDKKGWKRADWGLVSLLLAGSSVLQRGYRGAVIHWHVREWLPPERKCNLTEHKGRGLAEFFFTTQQDIARGFYTALNVLECGVTILHSTHYNYVSSTVVEPRW